jgi:hypothetical protein
MGAGKHEEIGRINERRGVLPSRGQICCGGSTPRAIKAITVGEGVVSSDPGPLQREKKRQSPIRGNPR